MLKKAHSKAQQYHLLFRTRNLGQRRGPQLRPHHRASAHGCSCLHWSVFHHLPRGRRGKGWHFTLGKNCLPGPCSLYSLAENKSATQQPARGTSPRPLGKIPQPCEREKNSSSMSFLLRWGTSQPVQVTPAVQPGPGVLEPGAGPHLAGSQAHGEYRDCWSPTPQAVLKWQSMLANHFPLCTSSFSMAFGTSLDFQVWVWHLLSHKC